MYRYTPEQKEYLWQIIPGHSHKEIADMINNKFNLAITAGRVKSFIGNNHLNTGRTGRFEKGHIPQNKGKKTGNYPGSEKTQFKKGHVPHNYRPVGSERVDVDGYTWVKIEDLKKWKMKHVLLWEKHNGHIPKNHVIIFGDKDKTNITLDNLILVSRKQLVRMNQYGLIGSDAELTKTGVIVADVMNKCGEMKAKG
ncbi:MAG: HNH endonuclease signature motif containing protein [Clostridiales bacterium]